MDQAIGVTETLSAALDELRKYDLQHHRSKSRRIWVALFE